MTIIGIDPGGSGGIAVIEGSIVSTFKLDTTEADIAAWLRERNAARMAYIERVHSMPDQGVASSFTFGQGYGFLRGLLIGLCIPFEEVTPNKWCKSFGLSRQKGESQTAWKNRHKAKAQQLFPHLKITHAIADALLIAEYGRRLKFQGVQSPADDASRCG